MGRCEMRLCELENKEVINACDCKKLGYIVDLIIDECNGCIEAMVIPKAGKLCGFFCDGSEYIIPLNVLKRSEQISSWWKCMKKKDESGFVISYLY